MRSKRDYQKKYQKPKRFDDQGKIIKAIGIILTIAILGSLVVGLLFPRLLGGG